MRSILPIRLLAVLLTLVSSYSWAFDHNHEVYSDLLKAHVSWTSDEHASSVNYVTLSSDIEKLNQYLTDVAYVSQKAFDKFTEKEQLAFLINAYNAYTLQWVTQEHQNIKSIKDLGTLFRSPWKKKKFLLFGELVSLDHIEHDLIRRPGNFDDPRIHMAVNCASIGCPALRPEAFVAARIDEQLNDGVSRFLSDESRNRIEGSVLYVSKIFSWYEEDFAKESGSLVQWLKQYWPQRNESGLNGNKYEIKFLDYDWSLNKRF